MLAYALNHGCILPKNSYFPIFFVHLETVIILGDNFDNFCTEKSSFWANFTKNPYFPHEIIYAHALKKSPRARDKYLGLAAGNSDYHTNILTDRSLR